MKASKKNTLWRFRQRVLVLWTIKRCCFFNLEMKQRVCGNGILRAIQLVIVPVHEGKRGGIVVSVFDPE